MQIGLRIKLLCTHLLVIVLAMGLSGILLLSSLERYFLRAVEDSLRAQARITAQALVPGADLGGPALLAQAPTSNLFQQRQASNIAIQTQNLNVPGGDIAPSDYNLDYLKDSSLQLGTQLETRIRVLNQQGQVLVDSWNQETGADLSADALIQQALGGQNASRTYYPAGAQMELALPVLLEEQLVGVVYLSQPLSDVTLVLTDLRARLWVSTLVALAFSGVVGLVFSGAITRPLRQLITAADAVAAGQYDTQVPVRSRDELGRLSHAFNTMTARLRAARQMQTDFVANVSHELRTPLTATKGMIETLRDGAVDDLDVRDRFLETLEKETNRLIRLVNDLLTLSRADSAALNLRRKPVALEALAQEIVAQMTPQAAARNLRVSLSAAPGLPSVWADPDRLAQVLVNLLDNALKYSRPGGQVWVALSADPDGCIHLTVRDEGIGIPAADLPRIGQRFYRADKARSRAQGGSGLGLAIAQALVSAHNGQLWLESAEGHGAIAHVTLPAPMGQSHLNS